MTSIMGLAAFFNQTVVVWNKKTLANGSAQQQVVSFEPTDTDPRLCRERMWSLEEIAVAHVKSTLMHIEWDGINHYASLVGPDEVTMCPLFKLALTNVTHRHPPAEPDDEETEDPAPQPRSVAR